MLSTHYWGDIKESNKLDIGDCERLILGGVRMSGISKRDACGELIEMGEGTNSVGCGVS